MSSSAENNHMTKSIAAITAEIKQELKQFVDTRVAMFKTELREKTSHWKAAAPLAGLGIVLISTAYLLITLSLVALLAVFIPSDYRWFLAFLGVGILWALVGGVAAYIAYREMQVSRLVPEKTVAILKGDKMWLQRELRKQI